jgi:hypothetical protein
MTNENNPLDPQNTVDQTIDFDSLPTEFPTVGIGEHTFVVVNAEKAQDAYDQSIKANIQCTVIGDNDPDKGITMFTKFTLSGGANPMAAKMGQKGLSEFMSICLGNEAKGVMPLTALNGKVFKASIKHVPSKKNPGKVYPQVEKYLAVTAAASSQISPI